MYSPPAISFLGKNILHAGNLAHKFKICIVISNIIYTYKHHIKSNGNSKANLYQPVIHL